MPANALDYITIKGFKSIASIDKLELRPINILIGANGAGKSNFIGAFSFLHSIREGRLQDYVTAAGGSERLLHFGSKTTKEILFHLSFRVDLSKVNQYKLKLAFTEGDSLFPVEEYAYYWNKEADPRPEGPSILPKQRRLEAGISNPNLDALAGWVRERMGSWRVYHVHDTSSSSPMRKTAKVNDNRFLHPDGSNIAAFLYFLQEAHEESYSLIRRTTQRVAPFFDDFQLQPLRLKPDFIKLEWRHRNSEQYFDAASLSDGTLRFITLATLFLQPEEFRPLNDPGRRTRARFASLCYRVASFTHQASGCQHTGNHIDAVFAPAGSF